MSRGVPSCLPFLPPLSEAGEAEPLWKTAAVMLGVVAFVCVLIAVIGGVL